MGDDDERRLAARVKIEEQRGDGVGRGAIEVAGRLVAEHQERIANQRAGDGGALLLAAGELAGTMIQAVAEADLCEQHSRART